MGMDTQTFLAASGGMSVGTLLASVFFWKKSRRQDKAGGVFFEADSFTLNLFLSFLPVGLILFSTLSGVINGRSGNATAVHLFLSLIFGLVSFFAVYSIFRMFVDFHIRRPSSTSKLKAWCQEELLPWVVFSAIPFLTVVLIRMPEVSSSAYSPWHGYLFGFFIVAVYHACCSGMFFSLSQFISREHSKNMAENQEFKTFTQAADFHVFLVRNVGLFLFLSIVFGVHWSNLPISKSSLQAFGASLISIVCFWLVIHSVQMFVVSKAKWTQKKQELTLRFFLSATPLIQGAFHLSVGDLEFKSFWFYVIMALLNYCFLSLTEKASSYKSIHSKRVAEAGNISPQLVYSTALGQSFLLVTGMAIFFFVQLVSVYVGSFFTAQNYEFWNFSLQTNWFQLLFVFFLLHCRTEMMRLGAKKETSEENVKLYRHRYTGAALFFFLTLLSMKLWGYLSHISSPVSFLVSFAIVILSGVLIFVLLTALSQGCFSLFQAIHHSRKNDSEKLKKILFFHSTKRPLAAMGILIVIFMLIWIVAQPLQNLVSGAFFKVTMPSLLLFSFACCGFSLFFEIFSSLLAAARTYIEKGVLGGKEGVAGQSMFSTMDLYYQLSTVAAPVLLFMSMMVWLFVQLNQTYFS